MQLNTNVSMRDSAVGIQMPYKYGYNVDSQIIVIDWLHTITSNKKNKFAKMKFVSEVFGRLTNS